MIPVNEPARRPRARVRDRVPQDRLDLFGRAFHRRVRGRVVRLLPSPPRRGRLQRDSGFAAGRCRTRSPTRRRSDHAVVHDHLVRHGRDLPGRRARPRGRGSRNLGHGRRGGRARITSRTRAIMPVHIYGHPVDMDPLLDMAAEHGLAIVEDAAEAHGAEYLSRRGPRQMAALRELRRPLLLLVLRQQARHERRGRDGPHRRRPARGPAAAPAEPGVHPRPAASSTRSSGSTSG